MDSESLETQVVLRPATNADCQQVAALIDRVFREYGDQVFLTGADADLNDLEQAFDQAGGAIVVLERAGAIVGSHGVVPLADQPGVCTFRRLYLAPELRGSGWGQKLMDWAIDWAAVEGFRRVEFWSDTRFERGHAFFRRCGFVSSGEPREMDDGWQPYREYFFSLDLAAGQRAEAERRTP